MMELPPLFSLIEPAEEAEESRSVVVFELAEECFAAEISAVSEVLKDFRLHAAPGAPPPVDGILNLRGRVATVLSGRRLLGLPPGDAGERERVLILEWQEELVGLRVDRVVGVRRVPAGALEPPLEKPFASGRGYLMGCFTLEGRVVSLLDLAAAIAAPLELAERAPTLLSGFAVDNL